MSTVAAQIDEPYLVAHSGGPGRIEHLIDRHFRRGRKETADFAPVLTRYWHELPHCPTHVRAQLFQRVRDRVRCGDLGEGACVAFALADPSADIVAAATAEYVGARPSSIERRAARVAAALDWIRRALAINRAAVFATLLGLHDEAVATALRSLCLLLDHRETVAVRLQLANDTTPAVARFLQEWQELIDLQPSA
jgi:hypothetical protein